MVAEDKLIQKYFEVKTVFDNEPVDVKRLPTRSVVTARPGSVAGSGDKGMDLKAKATEKGARC